MGCSINSLIKWLFPDAGLPTISIEKEPSKICSVPGVNTTPSLLIAGFRILSNLGFSDYDYVSWFESTMSW